MFKFLVLWGCILEVFCDVYQPAPVVQSVHRNTWTRDPRPQIIQIQHPRPQIPRARDYRRQHAPARRLPSRPRSYNIPAPRIGPIFPAVQLVPKELVIVREALQMENQEQINLKTRLTQDIDTKVADFNVVVPRILGANANSPDNKIEAIGKQSRVINWINIKARQHGVQLPLSVILATTKPAQIGKCPFIVLTNCNQAEEYRRIDGSCNNLANPLWGAGFTPFVRLLPPEYFTGFYGDSLRTDLPRQSGVLGELLQSPRSISNTVHDPALIPPKESSVTMEYTAYGQFLSHDVTDTPMEKGSAFANLDCCNSRIMTRRCAEIPIPEGDFFRQQGRTCLNFKRSKEVTDIQCNTGVREQLNAASSFIDGTSIYGQTEEHLSELRDVEGLLKVASGDNLPLKRHPNKHAFQIGINSLDIGDDKVSEVTSLVAISVIWYREHNRIATILSQFPRFSGIDNPTTRSQAIFDETRKIIIGILQHVTYSEYIPITVGPTVFNKYKLRLLENGYFTGYDSAVNPALTNAFATAALRFGHSMLRDTMSLVRSNGQSSEIPLRMKSLYWRSNFYLLFENDFQRGLLADKSEVCDRIVTNDARNHLFETKDGNGNDLAALNIQRGRDHGLPSYNRYRRLFGLTEATEFTTTESGFRDMTQITVDKMKLVYAHPGDVDLWTGGISEVPVDGGQVGPLFAELLAQEFEKLRVGDRFWYENQDKGFTPDQLKEIRRSSLARVLCNNVGGVTHIQPRAFEIATTQGNNDRVTCSNIYDIDLTKWL